MSKSLYLRFIEGLPLPTPQQYKEFAKHVFRAHSWNKHLPDGGDFLFCLAPDSGGGRCVVVERTSGNYSLVKPQEGGEYTEEKPRLHHSWRTTAEYRRRFGYLEFLVRPEKEYPFMRDSGELEIPLPDELVSLCSISLYTLATGVDKDDTDRKCGERIIMLYESFALKNMEMRFAPADREKAIELTRAWQRLSEGEKEEVLDVGRGILERDADHTEAVSGYLQTREELLENFVHPYTRELGEVEGALSRLHEWLVNNAC